MRGLVIRHSPYRLFSDPLPSLLSHSFTCPSCFPCEEGFASGNTPGRRSSANITEGPPPPCPPPWCSWDAWDILKDDAWEVNDPPRCPL